jgi:hypothetical protein
VTHRTRRVALLFVFAVCGVSAACSAILDLKPPPASTTDSGVSTLPSDASSEPDGNAQDAGTSATVCAPLAVAGDAAATIYSPFAASDDAATSAWEIFDTARLAKHTAYSGGTFDGRYVYFAGRATIVTQFDTTAPFDAVASWSQFDLATLDIPGFVGGFAGAAFDGRRYVYYVPYLVAPATRASVVVRFDTTGSFSAASSWAWFDTSTLPVGDASVPGGFFGAGFDGRYVYFVPRNDGTPDGLVVRYDTMPQDAGAAVAPAADAGHAGDAGDAGHAEDAGDAGHAGDAGSADANAAFGNLALWQTFDLSTVDPTALGYAGAVFDGTSLYLVPAINDAFDAAVHGGTSGVVARFKTGEPLTAPSSWATFDLSTVNGLAENFLGGAFDGRYVYLAPRGAGIAVRLDTHATSFAATSAWSTYDLTQLFSSDAASPAQYAGAAFDGRFVYFIPVGSGFWGLTRYDTLSTFTADCAWSTFDISQVLLSDASTASYVGAVFDGQYLYLVPDGDFAIPRFNAKSPSALPPLPAFTGSFL